MPTYRDFEESVSTGGQKSRPPIEDRRHKCLMYGVTPVRFQSMVDGEENARPKAAPVVGVAKGEPVKECLQLKARKFKNSLKVSLGRSYETERHRTVTESAGYGLLFRTEFYLPSCSPTYTFFSFTGGFGCQ